MEIKGIKLSFRTQTSRLSQLLDIRTPTLH
jgi:hypothetical protein